MKNNSQINQVWLFACIFLQELFQEFTKGVRIGFCCKGVRYDKLQSFQTGKKKKTNKKGDLQNFSLKISADDLFLSDGFVDRDILYCLVEPFHLELLLGFCLHKPETPDKKKNRQKLNFSCFKAWRTFLWFTSAKYGNL